MKELLDRFKKPFFHILVEKIDEELFLKKHHKEFAELLTAIVNEVAFHPDVLVIIDSPDDKAAYKMLFKLAWLTAVDDSTQLQEVLSEIDFTGSTIDDLSTRLRNIKPIVVTRELPDGVRAYLNESMRAHLWGLNRAAIVMIWSSIEVILKVIAVSSGKNLSTTNKERLIKKLSENDFISPESAKTFDEVRRLRNDVAHDKGKIGDAAMADVIIDVVKAIEEIYCK